MKFRLFLSVMLLLIFVLYLPAQEASSVLDSYKRNFAKASLGTKIQIIKNSKNEKINMGPLYNQAMKFLLDNETLLENEPQAVELSILAAQLLGETEFTESQYNLWRMFEEIEEPQVKLSIINALSTMEIEDTIIENMNAWLSRRNSQYRTGDIPDIQLIGAFVQALGKIGDPSSFSVLFDTLSLQYNSNITEKADNALYSLGGNFTEGIKKVIKKQNPGLKVKAIDMALSSDKLENKNKADVAQHALQVALQTKTNNSAERKNLREVRFKSISYLTNQKRSQATDLCIEHFDQTLLEYSRNIIQKQYVFEAIECLGAMGNTRSAERLTTYLGVLNSYKENNKEYGPDIVLRVIQNLGQIGDNVAYDNLLYVSYLDYTNTIRNAAKNAIDNLEW